jgi:hypothetical protein
MSKQKILIACKKCKNQILFTIQYSKIFDWTTTFPLVFGSTYYYRIASEKKFTTINNINLSTTAYSTTIKIKLPN